MKKNDRINNKVIELQKALDLADFYAFMLRESIGGVAIDDQTIQCAIACVRNDCYFDGCIVYEVCPMESWRKSVLN